MNDTGPRTLEEGRGWLLQRLDRGIHPLDGLDEDAARTAIESLTGLEPESWAASWGAAADRFAAVAAETADPAARREAFLQAYGFSFVGRYPIPNHLAKERQYERARNFFLEATSLDDPPLERVTVPFEGRQGEGGEVCFYLLRPPEAERAPVVMLWGGIDTWKEEMYSRMGRLLRSRGFAVLLLDMPGAGESPILAGADAERQWTPVFTWLAAQDDIEGGRCAAVGASFGGYWAMKLAYTHREHLSCCVNWGGGVHITFTPEWQEQSRNASSYLMDLMAARARIFGGETFDDYIASCSELSLLDQGLLEYPSAPLLLVNGRDDVQNSIDDLYLSLDHGDPKSVRVFDGGHMGEGPVVPTIVDWVSRHLTRDDTVTAPRRVVTGHDAAGRSVVLADGPAPRSHAIPGATFHELWSTTATPAPLAPEEPGEPTDRPLVTPPDPHGTIIRIVELAPHSRSPMHRTQSLDYGIVLSGAVILVLDDGSETALRCGDVVIQRGTDHAWVNETDEPARMAFVLVDGTFTDELRARLPAETRLFDEKLDR